MKFFVVTAAFLVCSGMSLRAGQSSSSGSQATSEAKPTVQSSGNSAEAATEKAKTKPNRVWTNDEISGVGGNGAISVVGKAGGRDSNPSSKNFQKTAPRLGARDKQAVAYRDRLHQLNNELEATDKRISQLRNFKADNSSPSGGITSLIAIS